MLTFINIARPGQIRQSGAIAPIDKTGLRTNIKLRPIIQMVISTVAVKSFLDKNNGRRRGHAFKNG
jgi:hypothetical protein